MSYKNAILRKEDELRQKVQDLSDENKKLFYSKIERKIKDPDTYAVLNWLFLSGLHHLYLKKWLKGAMSLFLFVISISLLFSDGVYFGIGIGMLVAIFLLELNELFNSQSIVQNYNNEISEEILNTII